ncbi:MAG: hypothetical protein WAT19_01980 [Ferruginibacter sp.]
MSTRTSPHTSDRTATQPLRPALVRGALFGVIASLIMAAFAMMAAATYQGVGFFTPLYHIASTLISPSTMMASMQQAADGSTFYFAFGPAVLGAVIHMMIGAMYGAVFAVAAAALRLHDAGLVAAGALWGVLVFLISSFVALPLVATLLGSGDQITHMASMVGYGTFLAEHVLFGLTLGLLLASSRLLPRR